MKKLRDIYLFLRIILYACMLPFLTRFLRLVKLIKFFTPNQVSVVSRKYGNSLYEIQKVVRYVNFLYCDLLRIRRNCFSRSLIYYKFAHEIGFAPQIHFGVVNLKLPYRSHIAHAWVTINGRPLGETGDPGKIFHIIYSYPGFCKKPVNF